MKKLLAAALIALASLAPLSANTLLGFGLCYSGDTLNARNVYPLMTVESSTFHSGIGFNADVYVGQKIGFYAGGAFGLLVGIRAETQNSLLGSSVATADMSRYSTKLFGNALLGLGAFLPLGSFDVSGALGFGLDFLSLRQTGDDAENVFASLGPGLSLSLGVPVATNTEAYLACRLVYGMVLLGTYPSGYRGDFSFTPAIGVRIKA